MADYPRVPVAPGNKIYPGLPDEYTGVVLLPMLASVVKGKIQWGAPQVVSISAALRHHAGCRFWYKYHGTRHATEGGHPMYQHWTYGQQRIYQKKVQTRFAQFWGKYLKELGVEVGTDVINTEIPDED